MSDQGLGSLDPQVDYDASSKVLRLLLKPDGMIKGSMSNFLFASGNVVIKPQNRPSFLERFAMKSGSGVADFTNSGADTSMPVSCVGFSAENPGSITVLDVPSASGLFVLRAAFLCCSRHCNVIASSFPITGEPLAMALHHHLLPHHATLFFSRALPRPGQGADDAPCLLFVQSGDAVLEKVLVAGETFVVALGCLVGFCDQVSIQLQTFDGGIFQPEERLLLRIAGPGRIWLSGSGSPATSSSTGTGAEGRALYGGRRHRGHHSILGLAARMVALSLTMAALALVFARLVDLDLDIRAELV